MMFLLLLLLPPRYQPLPTPALSPRAPGVTLAPLEGGAGQPAVEPLSPAAVRKQQWTRPEKPSQAMRGQAAIIYVKLLVEGRQTGGAGGDLRSLAVGIAEPTDDHDSVAEEMRALVDETNAEKKQKIVERLGMALEVLDDEAGRYRGNVYHFLASDPLHTTSAVQALSKGECAGSAAIIFMDPAPRGGDSAGGGDGDAAPAVDGACHQALRAAVAMLTRLQSITAVDATLGIALGPALWFEASDPSALTRLPVALGPAVSMATRLCKLAVSLGLPSLTSEEVYRGKSKREDDYR